MRKQSYDIFLSMVVSVTLLLSGIVLSVAGIYLILENNGDTYINEDEDYISIGNNNIEIGFDKNFAGGLDKIIDKKTGIDLRPDKEPISTLFLMFFNNGTATEGALNWMALNTEYNTETRPDYSKITIINSNLKGYSINAITTVTIHNEDPYVKMRLTIENNEDFIIESILFPIIWGLGQIGEDSSDDTLFYPGGDGVLLHDPLSELANLYVSGDMYPGTLSMQLLCHYDKDETGLYFATYDTEGNPKKINYGPMEWDGKNHLATSFELYTPEYENNDFTMGYDSIIGTYHGDWYEAASLYKKWAVTTPFVSGGKIYEGKDTPEWFLETSIIQLLNRPEPETEVYSFSQIDKITKVYSDNTGLDTTVLIIGWEKNGAWIGPNYYPPVEGDEAFQNAMDNLKNNGNHGFIYISGTIWRITRDDIGYANYDLFNSEGLPWVALKKDETPYYDPFYESIGWHSARMDPMTDYWHEIVVNNALEGVRLGIDVIQIDEFPIGAIYPCYNAFHGHPIGYSTDISNAYGSILEDIRNQGRNINSNFIISTEEPCEFYLPYIDTYVSRDNAPEALLYLVIVDTYGDKAEFIPFFSYVYHEYVTSFGEGIGMDKGYATSFYNQMARALSKMFVSGEIMKVGGTSIDNWNIDLFELFKRTATATTTYASDYLIKGEPLFPPEIDVPLIRIDWYNSFSGEMGTPITEPAIFNSAWITDDGKKGFIFNNWYTSTIDFVVDINDEDLPDEHYSIVILRNGDREVIIPNTTLPRLVDISLYQNDIALIEILNPVNSNPPINLIIEGPSRGKINTEYSFSASAIDPDGDQLYYQFYWGDGTDSGWLGPIDSGITINSNYSWDEQGDYNLRVRAKDTSDVVSEWATLKIDMPVYKISNFIVQFLERIMERFPYLKYLTELHQKINGKII